MPRNNFVQKQALVRPGVLLARGTHLPNVDNLAALTLFIFYLDNVT